MSYKVIQGNELLSFIKDSECNSDTPLFFEFPEQPIYGQGHKICPRIPGKRITAYDEKTFLPELLPLEKYVGDAKS